jgi:hypothetical protein
MHLLCISISYFSYIVAVSYTGVGNWSTRRKAPPVARHWQTFSYSVVLSAPQHFLMKTHCVVPIIGGVPMLVKFLDHLRNHGSVSSLLTTTIYKKNLDRKFRIKKLSKLFAIIYLWTDVDIFWFYLFKNIIEKQRER